MSSKLAWAAKPLTTAIAAVAPASLPGIAALLGIGTAVASGAALLAGFIGLEAAQFLADKGRHKELTDFFKLSLTNDALTRNELLAKIAALDAKVKPPGFDPAKAAEAMGLLREIARRSEEQAQAHQQQEDEAWNVKVYLETITADVQELLAKQPAMVEAFAQRVDTGFAEMREHLVALHADTALIKEGIAGVREVAEDTNAIARQILAKNEERSQQDSTLAEQAKQITRFMDREDGYRQQIKELENAVRTVKQYADQGDAEARQALDEARASGDTDHLYAVLKRVTDEVFEKQQADYISRCREIASLAYLRGDIPEAEKRLGLILKHLPNDLDAINRQGHIAYLRGNLDNASKLYKKLLELSEDERHHAASYGNLGRIYRTRGDLDQAEKMYRESLKIEEHLGNQEGMAIQFSNLGLVYQTRGDLNQAEKMLRKSLEIDEQLGNQEGLASGNGNLGLIYQTRGDLDQAEKMLRKSLEIDKQLGNREGMASDYGNLGLIYQTRGDLDQAEKMFRKSIEFEERLGRQEGMASAYGNLGLIYLTRGDLDQAEKMLRKALEIEEHLGKQEGMASCYGNLGLVYQARSNLDQAEKMLRKALEIEERLGRQKGMATQHGNLGAIYLTRGDLDQAEKMLRKALEINERLGWQEGMANHYGNLGLICRIRGDLSSAREHWQQALACFESVGMVPQIEQVRGLLDGLP